MTHALQRIPHNLLAQFSLRRRCDVLELTATAAIVHVVTTARLYAMRRPLEQLQHATARVSRVGDVRNLCDVSRRSARDKASHAFNSPDARSPGSDRFDAQRRALLLRGRRRGPTTHSTT